MDRPFDIDDKDLVILVVFVLCGMGIVILPAETASVIIEKALYGLFGIVTGKAIAQNGNGKN